MFKKFLALLVCCGAAAVVCAAGSPKSFPDIFPKRQINDSWRTIALPAGTDTGKLALFELRDGKLTGRAVPFRIFKTPSGEVILKFKVPGINPGAVRAWSGKTARPGSRAPATPCPFPRISAAGCSSAKGASSTIPSPPVPRN